MPTSLITHGHAERQLLGMPVGQLQRAWGRSVLRLDATAWSVAGGPALPLLPALDAALGRPDGADDDAVRFPRAYRLAKARAAGARAWG